MGKLAEQINAFIENRVEPKPTVLPITKTLDHDFSYHNYKIWNEEAEQYFTYNTERKSFRFRLNDKPQLCNIVDLFLEFNGDVSMIESIELSIGGQQTHRVTGNELVNYYKIYSEIMLKEGFFGGPLSGSLLPLGDILLGLNKHQQHYPLGHLKYHYFHIYINFNKSMGCDPKLQVRYLPAKKEDLLIYYVPLMLQPQIVTRSIVKPKGSREIGFKMEMTPFPKYFYLTFFKESEGSLCKFDPQFNIKFSNDTQVWTQRTLFLTTDQSINGMVKCPIKPTGFLHTFEFFLFFSESEQDITINVMTEYDNLLRNQHGMSGLGFIDNVVNLVPLEISKVLETGTAKRKRQPLLENNNTKRIKI